MRIRLLNLFLVIAAMAIVISSCKKPTGQAQRDLEQEYLSKYIGKYHPGLSPKSSGLYFIDSTTVDTTGVALIKAGDYVKVFYRGYLIEDNATNGIQRGAIFDSYQEGYEPFSFTVGAGAVIAGWEEAMTYMKEGSEVKLVIPSKLAYSSAAQGTIPAYSPLIFYIKVYKVYPKGTEFPTIELRRP
jgi:FKBP-type peptidyl-prolyl cis-trans isomerase